MSISEIKTDSQSLCKCCGLCCDGTLFGNARLSDEDDRQLLASRGIKIAQDAERFLLPCIAQQNRICTLYDVRPDKCKEYRCELLRKFISGEVSYREAQEIIVKTSVRAGEIRSALVAAAGRGDVPLRKLYLLVKELGGPAHNQLLLEFVALQLCLDRYFRAKPVIGI